MSGEVAVKMECNGASSIGTSPDCSIVKVEDNGVEDGSFEYITNATLKLENADTNETDLTACNAEISPCENSPFRLSIIDEDGNVLETYFEENGTLKPIAVLNNEATSNTEKKEASKKRESTKIAAKNKKGKNKCRKKNLTDIAFQNEKYCCSLCNYEYEGRKSFKKHLIQHIKKESDIYECCFCNYRSSLRGHMNRHIMQRHCPFQSNIDEKRFACKICGKKFFEKKDYRRHMFVHTHEGNLKCRLCEFSHIRQSCLDKHMLVYHKVSDKKRRKQHITELAEICECDYCGYKCRGKKRIAIHIELHLGVFRYRCDQCGYTSLFSGDVKKHATIHSNERSFVCGICSKSFKRRAHLLIHSRKKYSCVNDNKRKRKSQ